MRPLLILLALLSVSCRQAHHPQQAAIDRVVRAAFATGGSAGLGVSIVQGDEVIYEAHLGLADASSAIPVTEQTLWYISSTSKSLTGFGLALLVEDGLVDAESPISDYLPDAEWPSGYDAAGSTVADFLAHTHGLGNGPLVLSAAFTGEFPESDFPRLLQYNTPREDRSLAYSNLGYNVASMVIERVTGLSWKSFLDERVLSPVGMRDTHARTSGINRDRIAKPHRVLVDGSLATMPFVKTDRTMNAAGGTLSTIGDLTRWVRVQMNGGMLNGDRVFPADVVANAHRILRPQDRQFAFFQRDGWGMGFDIGSYREQHMVSRFGGYQGTRSHISFLPEAGIGVVAQVNGPAGSAITDIVAAYAFDVLQGRADADSLADARIAELAAQTAELPDRVRQFEQIQEQRDQPLPHPLTAYAGSYQDPALGVVDVETRGDTLYMHWGVLSGPMTVFDATTNAMRHELLGGGSVARFVFDGQDTATAIEMFDRRLTRR
ncbi:MAG: serine hydrolase [Rhodothermales bacterium]|nr:serine hydrolase [Rhodothermales bacterium]MBO6781169.1 serine hydrolase [Rhodothermales bacterium]